MCVSGVGVVNKCIPSADNRIFSDCMTELAVIQRLELFWSLLSQLRHKAEAQLH